jgi:hypothetical protein
MGFRNRLTEAVQRRGVTMTTWSSGGSSSRNLVQLSTTPKRTVLYVKEFNITGRPGFWGLTRNQVTRLEKANVRWFAVLLLRSSTAGYLLTSAEVRHHVADRSFELSRDGDYKVNEDLDLISAQRFQSLRDLSDQIF